MPETVDEKIGMGPILWNSICCKGFVSSGEGSQRRPLLGK
jgi:hypothetical protein